MRFSLVLATLVLLSAIALAQVPVVLGHDGPFQVGFAANLNIGDSVVNLTNDGANGGFFVPASVVGLNSTFGNLCVNVYTFDPQEEEIACCSCLVTPNGLNSLSVKNDLISNTLTPAIPTSVVIKLIASEPDSPPAAAVLSLTICNPATAGFNNFLLRFGMIAWGSTLAPSASPGTYNAVNVPFVQGTLTEGNICNPTGIGIGSCDLPGQNIGANPTPGSELYALTTICSFIQANGTGYGICNSCNLGALSGTKQ
jgi:hypothetical protein